MNLYLLVEGDTEQELYDFFLQHLIPKLSRVDNFDEVTENNYYIFNGNGYPKILNKIKPAIDDINNSSKYSHFLICTDCDELTVLEREMEIQKVFDENNIKTTVEVIKILQNKCIETWLLGNRRVCSRNPQGDFLNHINFYNVYESDPELMDKPNQFPESVAKYHVKFLRKMLYEKHAHYNKNNVKYVATDIYVKELIKRINDTDHIQTFKKFYDFCLKLSS